MDSKDKRKIIQNAITKTQEENERKIKEDISSLQNYLKKPWEQDIGLDITNSPEFTYYITFFIESSAEYSCLMELFNEAAKCGKRWEIKVISMEFIKNTVLDNCSKTREKKPFNLLCDQIIRYIISI